ncbi:MAG TPA: MCP four helix bundle domain-containing protein, partial [Spirochaetia bacterium]
MRTSIRRKLTLGFIATAAIAAVVGGVSVYSITRLNASVNAYLMQGVQRIDGAERMHIALLDAIAAERDFQRTGDPSKLTEFAQSLDELRSISRGIRPTLSKSDAAGIALQDFLLEQADIFEKGFSDAARAGNSSGSATTGLQGEFRDIAHQVESTVTSMGSLLLERDYLEIRRHEKDYLLRGDPSDAQAVTAGIADFKTHMRQVTMPAATRAALSARWDGYADTFAKLVQSNRSVTLNDVAGTSMLNAL